MNILVISGFLGAGKTTFIKELIRKSKTQPVVLENEFGENSIDSAEIQKDQDLKVLEFMEGCVCCTKKDSFSNSILAISAALDPEYLIVEPSGVAKLSAIHQNIQKVSYERIRLMKSVVVLYPGSYRSHMADWRDIYEDQIKHADIIVFSKLELAQQEDIDYAVEDIHKLNPSADILSNNYCLQDDAWWSGLLNGELRSRDSEGSVEDASTFSQIGINNVRLSNFGELITLLEDLQRGVFGKIPRAKGYLLLGDEKVRFDLADGMYAITGASDSETPLQCVFIGQDISESKLRRRMGMKIKKAKIRHRKMNIPGKTLAFTKNEQLEIIA